MLRLLAWLLLVLHMCILTLSTPFADAAAREVAVAPLHITAQLPLKRGDSH